MARQAKIYCEIKYERGNGPGKGFVARFFRKRDQVQVGAAFWNKKTRAFDNVRGIGGNTLDLVQVLNISNCVPVLRSNGVIWYSDTKESP